MENELTSFQLVTIEEMRELLQSNRYRLVDEEMDFKPELEVDPKSGLYYTDYFKEEFTLNLVLAHLLAEQCMAKREQLDWGRTTNGYDCAIVAKIIELYMHPLVWCEIPNAVREHYIVMGRFAMEELVEREEHRYLYAFVLDDSREQRALWFADHLPSRAIPKWETLMTNYRRADLLKVSSSEPYSISLPIINVNDLEENLIYIFNSRGKDKVIELVERLRNDWKRLEKLQICGFDKLSEGEKEQLKDYVFFTLDNRIEYWETGEDELDDEKFTDAEDNEEDKPELCIFTKKAIREDMVDEIIDALKKSMPTSRRDKARALVEEIRYWQGEEYIDKYYDASVYYDEIKKIMKLPFSYDGFRKYYYEYPQ